MQRLTLVGMPGSGKSAVGRIVAKRLGWGFVDTDCLIELSYGVNLQAVVDRLGLDSFRMVEEEIVLKLDVDEQTVISTGGSVVYSDPAMRHLASISTVVFLDLPVDAIRRHVAGEAPRGIVGMPEGGLEELYEQRFPLYRKHAHVVVLLDSDSPEEAATRVLFQLQRQLQP